MGTPSVTNIDHSGAVLWYAPEGESNPDETSVAFGGDWGGNWARVGYTKAPLTLAYESEESDINVEEELAPVKRRRIAENLMVETVLAELTAAYLTLAGGNQDTVSTTGAGASQDGYEEVGLGGTSIIAEYKWGFEWLHVDGSGNSQPARMFIHSATAMINGQLEFSKKADDYPGIPIQLKALSDTSQSAGQKLCLFQRVTAEATS